MTNSLVTGKTGVCGLIGDPVEHTMSPVMHNAAFEKLAIDYIYLPFQVKKEELAEAIAGMRALNIRGLNVTIPHKVAVLPMLDRLDPFAEKIGAVNTIVNDDGVLTGYNTDAAGFLQALLDKGIDPAGKKAVVLGAGGASRAISFALAERGAQLVILNRQMELDWAEKLASQISQSFNREVIALEINDANLSLALANAEILINATSAGMSPHSEETPVPAPMLRRGLVVFDAVYNPLQTRLMSNAEKSGAITVSGLDMLAWQGALAFEKWTGQQPPLELMKEKAMKALGYEK